MRIANYYMQTIQGSVIVTEIEISIRQLSKNIELH